MQGQLNIIAPLFSLFNAFIHSDAKSTDDQIMDEIKRCTNAVNNSLIEQTAYVRGAAAIKNIDLKKYKDEVRREFQAAGTGDALILVLYQM